LRLIEEEVNAEAVNLLPPGGEDEALGYCVVRLLQAVDACAECERWGGASDEAVGVRQMRRGRERHKELPPLL
jgi:THO complex subunit 5